MALTLLPYTNLPLSILTEVENVMLMKWNKKLPRLRQEYAHRGISPRWEFRKQQFLLPKIEWIVNSFLTTDPRAYSKLESVKWKIDFVYLYTSGKSLYSDGLIEDQVR